MVITRKALIISNPGEPNSDNYCFGVKKDVENYKAFLMSPVGGFWNQNEIICVERPDAASIIYYLSLMRSTDYTMIIFCGHGYTSYDITMLELRKNQEISEDKLKIGANKRTIILDCCRTPGEILNESFSHRYDQMLEKSMLSGIKARINYDSAISQAPYGTVVTYACDIGETANDDSRFGGYYSHSLISVGHDIVNSPYKEAYMSIVNAHNKAAVLTVKKSEGQQNPQISKPRSEPYFPFAVKA